MSGRIPAGILVVKHISKAPYLDMPRRQSMNKSKPFRYKYYTTVADLTPQMHKKQECAIICVIILMVTLLSIEFQISQYSKQNFLTTTHEQLLPTLELVDRVLHDTNCIQSNMKG